MDFNLVITLALILGGILLTYILYKISSKKLSKKDVAFFRIQWKKITENSDAKHAVLEADKLLNIALTKSGYHGNVGEQLKKASKNFTDINGIWTAHKLRNRIAHELNIQISGSETKQSLRSFERGLKDLGAL